MRNWTRPLTAAAVGLLVTTLAACGSDDSSTTTPDGEFDAASYFSGKTVKMLVTSSPGGGTDSFGRFVARELSDQIPGHPRVSVTNDTDLGGYGNIFEAPAEDLVIGATSRSSALYTSGDDPAARHDPNELQVIGGLAGDPRGWATFGDLAGTYDSVLDATDSAHPLKMGATVGGPGDVQSDVFLYSWLCQNLSLACEYVNVADDSTSDIDLMIQRDEVNVLGNPMITFMREFWDRLDSGDATLLFQYAVPEDGDIPLPDGMEAGDLADELPADLQQEYATILPLVSSSSSAR